MAHGETIIPAELNLDISPLRLGSQAGRFLRNWDYAQHAGNKDGSNSMVHKTLPANELYHSRFTYPDGDNQTVGRYVSQGTNEVYVFNWNSLNNHHIYRIKNGLQQMVFQGPELRFSRNPLFYIGEGRCAVFYVCIGDQYKTFLIFTDANNDQRMICVEDSIATRYFDPAIYTRFISNRNREELINLALAAPWDCIGIQPVKTPGKKIKKIKYNYWQFRISYIDVYGRPSEHGVISDPFYLSDCDPDGADCLDLTFDAGGPLVENLKVEFRRGCSTEWQETEMIAKYENCEKPWYERKINRKLIFNRTTNKITYRFCADKKCKIIPDNESQRIENPLARISESLFQFSGGIAVMGNTYKHKPLSCEVLEKIHFEIEKPDISTSPTIATRTVIVWMVITNFYADKKNQAVWRQDDKQNVFGGIDVQGRKEDRVGGDYGQRFGDPDQEGFIGVLRGGTYATISKQYIYSGNDFIEHGIASDFNAMRGNTYVQRFEFKNVLPGNYVFRIVGHQAKLTDPDHLSTSTNFGGLRQANADKRPNYSIPYSYAKELRINVCEKDYDSLKDGNTFVEVVDLTHPTADTNFSRSTRVSTGYAYETNEGSKGRLPIMGARVHMDISGDADAVWTAQTDYNGYFFAAAKDKNHTVRIKIQRNCTQNDLGSIDWDRNENSGLKHQLFFATSVWPGFLSELCNRIKVKGKILDCVTGSGMPNIMVGMSNGQFVQTNVNGEYELLTYTPQVVPIGDSILVLGSGRCRVQTCSGSNCIPALPFTRPTCVNCQERIVDMGSLSLRIDATKEAGLQLGGLYPFGIIMADWADRKSYTQTRKEFILDIPTANEIGGFAFPRVRYRFDPGTRFPLWVKRIYLAYGRNLRYSDFHSWIVDRFMLIDATGNENKISPTQIRIYYSSLNEYNKQHNFSTNSTWQIIDERDSLKVTDQVHFVANGDGILFPDVITELVRFDRDGRYFQIDYNPKLAALKDGALIKFFREQDCKDANLFNEVCEYIEVIDGIPQVDNGYMNAFDSYFVNRQIPVPLTTKKKVKKAVENSNPVVYEEIEESETVNVLKNFGWPFEHHSPSDFWGNKCANRGRGNSSNELENILCKENEIALSGVMGSNGLVNYLHYFDEPRKKEFEAQGWGAFICGIPLNKAIFVICENYSFIVPYDENAVRMDNGRAVVLSAERQFGEPRNGSTYGCRKWYRNTIASYEGKLVVWVDDYENGLIVHNFETGVNAAKDKYETFLRQKIKSIQQSGGSRYPHGHINPKDFQYYLTDFNLESLSYITDSFQPEIENNETIAVDLATNSLRKFCSFTPEMFASLKSDDKDKQFFSFKGGMAYSHYNPNPTVFNNFYGVQCQRPIKVAIAVDPAKVKQFMAIEVYTDTVVMYSPQGGVTTEWGQVSEIPRNFFRRGLKFWQAPFLCDINTLPLIDKPLTEGNKMEGRWLEILLIGDPDNLSKYSELTGVIIFANGVDKSGAENG